MEELMPSDDADGGEKAGDKNKANVITPCLRFLKAEPEPFWIDFIAHDDQSPDPDQEFKENEKLEWNIKPFIFIE